MMGVGNWVRSSRICFQWSRTQRHDHFSGSLVWLKHLMVQSKTRATLFLKWSSCLLQVTLFSGFVSYEMVRNAFEGDFISCFLTHNCLGLKYRKCTWKLIFDCSTSIFQMCSLWFLRSIGTCCYLRKWFIQLLLIWKRTPLVIWAISR